MKKLLLNLLILVFSTSAISAEKIVHNGEEGVFIKKDKAAEMTVIVKSFPSIKKQKDILELKVKKLEKINETKEKQLEVERQISKTWESSFKTASEEISKRESKEDIESYIYMGLFVGGIIVGAVVMYGASEILNNIK